MNLLAKISGLLNLIKNYVQLVGNNSNLQSRLHAINLIRLVELDKPIISRFYYATTVSGISLPSPINLHH